MKLTGKEYKIYQILKSKKGKVVPHFILLGYPNEKISLRDLHTKQKKYCLRTLIKNIRKKLNIEIVVERNCGYFLPPEKSVLDTLDNNDKIN